MHPFSEWLTINVGSKQAEQAMDIVEKMLRDEREACAVVAEKFFPPEMDYKWDEAGQAIASAIRGRTRR